jgi:hypothetical protein
MKRQFAALVLVAGIISQMSGIALAGQQSGGNGSHPSTPPSGGMPNDQNNQNKTGQAGDNTSKIYGDNNKVEQNNTLVNQTYQDNQNKSFSPKSSSNSSATSGSSSGSSASGGQSNAGSNIKFGDSYSKYDGRQDNGVQTPGLSSNVNYTNTYYKGSNICGVVMQESGVTPLSKSFSVGVNLFGVGGGAIGSSSQKFTKEQLAMLSQHASAMSRVNAEQSMLMSSPTLAKYYLAVALERDMLAQGYKADQAKADATSLAELATSGDWKQMVSNAIANSARLCSIYSQPKSEAPPTIYNPPTTSIPVINVPDQIPAKN